MPLGNALNKEVKVIFGLVRMKVNAARPKIVSLVISTLISGFLVSIPAQKVRSLVFKIFVFFIMAAPFVGSTLNLVLGTLLFAIPQITSLSLEDNLPKKKLFLPKGVFKTVVMVFVMALASNMIEGAFSSPEAFLKWSFVVMALPGFILHYLDAITDAPETDWKTTENGRKVYRIGGVVIFVLMVLVVKGVDIASWLVG